jgi:hypothetical protein
MVLWAGNRKAFSMEQWVGTGFDRVAASSRQGFFPGNFCAADSSSLVDGDLEE